MHEVVKGIWRRRRLMKGMTILRDFGGRFLLDFQELSFGVGLDQQRHRFARGFGHEDQDIHMISWSQVVVLVGREDSRFGQCLHSATAINKASEQTEVQHQTQVFRIVYLFYFAIKFYYLWINLYVNVLRMCSIKGIFEFYCFSQLKVLLNFTVMFDRIN